MADLPLSKTLDPADFAALAEELKVVDQHFTKAMPQHAARRWEYAMAIRALDTWLETRRGKGTAGYSVDVGGGGSPFRYMVSDSMIVVDPAEADGQHLEAYLETAPRLSQTVFCLSVLEHVVDLPRFLYHLACLVAPGGLLFLTVDYCDDLEATDWPIDRYHFHWMRQRIFSPRTLARWVLGSLAARDFEILGTASYLDYQPTVYDYSFASLALRRRP